MNNILDEYGDALVACVITAILLPFILFATKTFCEKKYPVYENKSMATTNAELIANSGSPEVVGPENYRIRAGDTSFDTRTYKDNPTSEEYQNAMNKYKALVKAYATGTGDHEHKDTPIDVVVYGTENIDVNAFEKVYTITFKATNEHGHITTKQMKILIG